MPITIRVRPRPLAAAGRPARPKSFWGAEIRRIRQDQRMSQRRLARLAGVDRSCLLRFENGESRGNLDLIERLLGVLGYELDMMWRGFVGGGFAAP
ncbi:MAG: helix-turn-helix transcriptional regulator [Hyphomicrobium sp.]|nr:helix-turn-helix transcriptional regulator [Hyphomicrobium sp.]